MFKNIFLYFVYEKNAITFADSIPEQNSSIKLIKYVIMHFLGIDIGSSSVKVSILNGETGNCVGSSSSPSVEMEISAPKPGWAEQSPNLWWNNFKIALGTVLRKTQIDTESIKSIGISYQMHGLVLVDHRQNVLRPSIIWCDSRATTIGNKAFTDLGKEYCLSNLLNSPGNFTASKLKWVKENEPLLYNKISKIMLPGDYLAMRLTGEAHTTVSGLSEGIIWNFKDNKLANKLLNYYNFSSDIIPNIVPTFGIQGTLRPDIATELGLSHKTTVSYRAGDQPNNALSLNVVNPGEIAATAGTSGVVYGISDELKYDPLSRVNTFAHVNYTPMIPRFGVLLCINGTGILNAWGKRITGGTITYNEMNQLSKTVKIGSEGLSILPFGNGSERILNNRDIGSHICGLNFNIHNQAHFYRAIQEGIIFSFKYGMEIMKETGIQPNIIRAGNANMFLSPVFREGLANICQATIEIYNTDGAIGAARGAAIGSGYYKNISEAFQTLKKEKVITPDDSLLPEYTYAYEKWKENLQKILNNN